MLKKLTNKIFALSLAFAFASAFLLAACGSGAANPDKEYTVTFVTGVIGWVVEPLVGKAGAPVTAPVAPDREGYKFGGWTYNGQDYALSVMPSRNITLSAKWNRIFTITFNSAGGSEVMPVVAAETERIAAPPDPVYEGHKFSYWTLDGARFYFTAMPSRDITLTAVWAEAVTIRFDTGVAGVAAPPPMVEVPGAPIAAPAAPKNPGFVLSGWYDGETLFRFPATMPDEDLTLTAKWVAGGVIKFLSGIEGVASPDDLIALPGAAISAPDTRTLRPGYHAEGWYRTDGRLFIFNTMPSSAMSEPITLTAKWVEGSKLPALIVTMREENGALIPITDERFGPTPWNQGYPFSSTKAKVQYVPCSIGISGAGGGSLAEAVPGVFKPKGNGSFRPDPTAKRPYRLKFDKKQSVFGWPKSKQFALISASHNMPDDSKLIAHSAFDLCRDVLKGLEYAARTQPVDLYVNGVYRGIYIFCEKVRVDEGRIEIDSEHAGVAGSYKTDTGYLLFYGNGGHVNNGEDDRARFGANAGNEFLIESPKPGDIDDPSVPEATAAGYTAQRNYIQARTRELVDSMSVSNFNTFLNIADIDSFVDGYIIQELYGNTDIRDAGYYLYKKGSAQGGKWYCGPPWDFDATVKFQVSDSTGIKVGNGNNPLISNLYRIPAFMTLVKARWKEKSPEIKTYLAAKFNAFLDDPALSAAFLRGAGSNANNGYINANWVGDAELKRDWLLNRIGWLDGEWG